MSLFDHVRKTRAEKPPGVAFVENVANLPATNATFLQHPENKRKNINEGCAESAPGGVLSSECEPRGALETVGLGPVGPSEPQNVVNVACETVNGIGPVSLFNSKTLSFSTPYPRAQATNATNEKADCESCPAAGHWDGYLAWGLYPTRYCFHAAYFLGKTAKPRKCEEARRDCPKNKPRGLL
jgi:hypothetical protein